MQHYTFESHHGMSLLFIVALIATFILVIWVISLFGGAKHRQPDSAIRNQGARSNPVGLCQRCRSPLPVDAAYCARCGMAVTRTAPIPMLRQRTGPGSSRWLAYAIIILLGLVGLGAFWFMSDSEPMPAGPVPRHVPGDAW